MGTLVCRVELNKNQGIVLFVENKDGKIEQTIVLDGKSITTTCTGEEGESSITQEPGSIAVKCENFKIDAETITCLSTKDTVFKSKGKFDIKSSKDMTLKSDANLTEQAGSDIEISGVNVSASADSAMDVSGLNVKVNADAKVSIEGAQLDLNGSAKSELKGAIVNVTSKGILKAEGSVTSVKGQMLNLEGSMIKLG